VVPKKRGAATLVSAIPLRTTHPALKDLGTQDREMVCVVNAFATIVDALNTIRYYASVAHPNKELFEEAEASLVLNAVRALFSYLVHKPG
jgi:hypothetical protein